MLHYILNERGEKVYPSLKKKLTISGVKDKMDKAFEKIGLMDYVEPAIYGPTVDEEAGPFPNWHEEMLKDFTFKGEEKFGKMLVFGTGGEDFGKGKDFHDMWFPDTETSAVHLPSYWDVMYPKIHNPADDAKIVYIDKNGKETKDFTDCVATMSEFYETKDTIIEKYGDTGLIEEIKKVSFKDIPEKSRGEKPKWEQNLNPVWNPAMAHAKQGSVFPVKDLHKRLMELYGDMTQEEFANHMLNRPKQQED